MSTQAYWLHIALRQVIYGPQHVHSELNLWYNNMARNPLLGCLKCALYISFCQPTNLQYIVDNKFETNI